MVDDFHVPCNFDGQAGRALRDAHTSLSPKAEEKGRYLGSGVWRGGTVAPKPTCYDQDSLSPLAHTVDGEAPQCPEASGPPCSLPGLGSLSRCSDGATHQPASQEPPPGSVTPDGAPTPQDCGL